MILDNHLAYGLIAHVDVNTYVTSARMYFTSARMSMFVHGRVSRKALFEFKNMQITCNQL